MWGWFSPWLWVVERRVAVVKVAVKCALTWSAKGRVVGKGLVGLAWALRPWAVFKAALAWLAGERLSPKGCRWPRATPSAPLLLKMFPKRGSAKVVGFPAGAL